MDIVGQLVAWHRVILLIAAVLAAASVAALWKPGLSDDYSLRTLAGSNDEQFDDLERFIRQFAGVELALIVVESDNVLARETQQCLTEIVQQAAVLPAVRNAASIAQAPAWIRPVVAQSRVVRGLLVSRDGRGASVMLQMRDDRSVPEMERSETVAALKEIVAGAEQAHPGHRIVLTGPYVVSYEMNRLVQNDLVTFGLWGAVAALAVLGLSLGSVRLAVYPLAAGLMTVALTLGMSIWLDINTALNLPMLVLLTAVLTMANCVHLAVGHDEHRGDATATVRRLARPCTGVIATTIVGFAAVGISALQPVRNFAVLMALGLAMGLVISLAGACATLKESSRRAPLTTPIARLLRRALAAARARPRAIAAAFAVVGLSAMALVPYLDFNLLFLQNFRPGDEIRTNYEFVERKLAPMQSIEILIERRDGGGPLTPEVVSAVQYLTDEYDDEPPIARVVSLVDFLTFRGAALPESSTALARRVELVESTLAWLLGENPLAAFLDREQGTLRVSFLAHDGPSAAEKVALGDRLREAAQELLGDEYRVQVTGLYYFFGHVARELLRDQVVSLVASVVGVFATMAVVLGSWRWAMVGMAPTLFAGASCVGLMALLSVPFNTVTSMMLAVALGVAVDDTIHYLWRYLAKRRQGLSPARAVVATQLTVGRACTLTSLVIAAGFAVLSFSRFLPIAHFGGVTSVVMVIALAANILLLPAVILVASEVFGSRPIHDAATNAAKEE